MLGNQPCHAVLAFALALGALDAQEVELALDMAKGEVGSSHSELSNLQLPFQSLNVKLRMSLYWLCYRHNNQIAVVIEPGASLMHARLRAGLAGLDEGTYTEGHELDRQTEKRVPKAMIGRRLSQEEAKRLLANLE
jgi:hypothetical protein